MKNNSPGFISARRQLLRATGAVLSACAVPTGLVTAQPKPSGGSNPFAGHWTYRSFRNDPSPVGNVGQDPSKLVALLFAEADWTVADTSDGTFTGQLSFGSNDIMDLKGTVTPGGQGNPPSLHVNGVGRKGTSTEHFFYDYQGFLAPTWPNGIQQRAASSVQ